MDTLNKNKLLIWATIILLVINIGTLTTFWLTSHGPEKRMSRGKFKNGMAGKNVLVNELKFTEEQTKFYLEAKKTHSNEIRYLRNKIDNNHRLIQEELFCKNPDTIKMKNLADSIGMLNAQFEKANIKHFYTIKSKLSDGQCQKFRRIMDGAWVKNNQEGGIPRR